MSKKANSSPIPQGSIEQGEGGVWYKYGLNGYALYYHDGSWRECAQVTNEQLSGMLVNGAKKEMAAIIPSQPISIAVLNKCAELQKERGAEYDKAGQQERSFTRVAQAFNAITGKNLTPAEVCLLLQVLKDVRQWSNPSSLHKDSVIDGVNYGALKAEELFTQFGETL